MPISTRGNVHMFAAGLLIICIIFGSLGQISMKTGMNQIKKIDNLSMLFDFKTITEIFTSKYILIGIILYGFALFLWLAALSSFDVSFMYPLLSLGYVITAIMAYIFLGESISLIRWAGIFLVVSGVIFIARS